jgi:hypothetical protein
MQRHDWRRCRPAAGGKAANHAEGNQQQNLKAPQVIRTLDEPQYPMAT